MVFSLEKCRTKSQTLYVNLQIPICCMLVELLEIYHGYCKKNSYRTKNHYALWCYKYDICILFKVKCRKTLPPILCYLYTETIKRRGGWDFVALDTLRNLLITCFQVTGIWNSSSHSTTKWIFWLNSWGNVWQLFLNDFP